MLVIKPDNIRKTDRKYMTIHYYKNDLPDNFKASNIIAIDAEMMGLNVFRDRLCVVQLSNGDGDAYLVHFDKDCYDAPNLKRVLSDPKIEKIFHFARYDLTAIKYYLGVMCENIFCTKIASKLSRTYTDRHSFKEVCRLATGIDISKKQQTSDWGSDTLDEEQKEYAASDVLYLHEIRNWLDGLLAREDRREIAQKCFDFLPHRAELDLLGWPEVDIFAHSS